MALLFAGSLARSFTTVSSTVTLVLFTRPYSFNPEGGGRRERICTSTNRLAPRRGINGLGLRRKLINKSRRLDIDFVRLGSILVRIFIYSTCGEKYNETGFSLIEVFTFSNTNISLLPFKVVPTGDYTPMDTLFSLLVAER